MGCLCFRKLSKIKPFTYAFGKSRRQDQESATATTVADGSEKGTKLEIKRSASKGGEEKACESMGNTSNRFSRKSSCRSRQQEEEGSNNNDNKIHSPQVSCLDDQLLVLIMSRLFILHVYT